MGSKFGVIVHLKGAPNCISVYEFETQIEILYNLQVNFPLCTIAHTPRMPEHCIEYVRVLLWSKENPFGGEGTAIDGDDPQHITWIMEKAQGGISIDIFDFGFGCFFLQSC